MLDRRPCPSRPWCERRARAALVATCRHPCPAEVPPTNHLLEGSGRQPTRFTSSNQIDTPAASAGPAMSLLPSRLPPLRRVGEPAGSGSEAATETPLSHDDSRWATTDPCQRSAGPDLTRRMKPAGRPTIGLSRHDRWWDTGWTQRALGSSGPRAPRRPRPTPELARRSRDSLD